MKTFSTSGTGSSQTLSEVETELIPVYDTLADAEADLTNLEEGQIIATKDYGTPTPVISTVDTVTDGNMNAVTSNAVADKLQSLKDIVTASTDFADFKSKILAL